MNKDVKINTSKPFFRRVLYNKLTITTVLKSYCILVILYCLCSNYLTALNNATILKYKLTDLLLIGIGELIQLIIIFIFPVLVIFILLSLYKKKKMYKNFGKIISKDFKGVVAISVFYTVFTVIFGCQSGINNMTLIYIASFSFVFVMILLAASWKIISGLNPLFNIKSNQYVNKSKFHKLKKSKVSEKSI